MSIEELPTGMGTADRRRRALVKARGVTKRFGGLLAVNKVDFDIPRGSIVSLIGPNGAGKTTFFNMITGYYVPTTGQIIFDGQPIVSMKGNRSAKKPHEVTALGIGRTFQNIRLFGTMSALDNVRVGHNVHLKSHWWDSVFRTPACSGRSRQRSRSAWRCSSSSTSTSGPRPGREPAVRRPAPARDRPRARDATEAAAARRTDGRHEQQRDPPDDRLHPPPAGRARPDRPAHRARHAGRHGHQRPGHRARPRRGHRRGTPAEVRANPKVIEAYLGRGAAES